jgi:hypothetical protein
MNPSGLTWRKFSRSTNGGTSLLRSLSPVVVAWIRDSKDSNSWSLTFSRVGGLRSPRVCVLDNSTDRLLQWGSRTEGRHEVGS